MRVAFVSDLQLRTERLDDREATLEKLLEELERRDVDELVIAGDVFQHRRPGVDELVVFRAFLESLPCGVTIVAGNHDVRGPNLAATVDVFRNLAGVFTRPDVVFRNLAGEDGPAVTLAALPWTHPGTARAAGLDRDEQADALLRVAADLFADAQAPAHSAIPVLVTHYALDGAKLPTGKSVRDLMDEPILDTRALLEQGWRYVFAGHIHAGGRVMRSEEAHAYSIGVPWRHDFGEEHLEPGFLVLDTEGFGAAGVEKVVLPDRPLVTLTGTAELDDGTKPDTFPAVDVAGAVVRVRVKATAGQDVDGEAIRRRLIDAGAVEVKVVVDVERKSRARVEGRVDELEPLAALDAWIAVRTGDTDEPEGAEALRALTRSLLESIR